MHAERDETSLEPAASPLAARHRSRPSSSGSPPLTSAWRIARPLSVRSGSIASIPSSAAGPRRGRQAAGQDRLDLARRDAGRVGELAPDAGEEPGGERLVAEDRAGLHRAHRVAADRPVRGAQLDPRQLRGPRGERLEAELEARRDRAADVGAVGGDAVERRRGPEVDDDRRRAVQPRGGEGVDEAVGADLVRAGRSGSRAARCRRRDDERPVAAGRRSSSIPPSGPGRPTRRRSPETSANEASSRRRSPSRRSSSSSARRPRVRRGPPRRHEPAGRNRPIVTFVLPMSIARSMPG